jgi:desulfoferrodoxin-like iron-binding protein
MAKVGEIFECELCGNRVIVTKEGSNPEIFCCGQPMKAIKKLSDEDLVHGEKFFDRFDLAK